MEKEKDTTEKDDSKRICVVCHRVFITFDPLQDTCNECMCEYADMLNEIEGK